MKNTTNTTHPLQDWAYGNLTEALKNTIKMELGWSDYNLTAKINLTRSWTTEEMTAFEKLTGFDVSKHIPDVLVRAA